MSKKIIYLLFSFLLLFSVIYFSCSAPEDLQQVVYDTVRVKKVDTLMSAEKDTVKREVSPLKFTFTIQLGAFGNRDNAENFASAAKDILNNDVEVDNYQNVFTVTVGKFDDNKKAENFLTFVKSKGFTEAFIRKK
jgi:cell division protein FtsN